MHIINSAKMNEIVTLGHGSGGRLTQGLIEKTFAAKFSLGQPLTDSAVLNNSGGKLAFTTDAFVVNPVFFPGGDIGKLAVCGTVNDLAVSGADPEYISASFIIEEGFLLDDLAAIADSMAEEAKKAGVRIVTGDTKVVEKGKCDKLFITTSGTGFLRNDFEHLAAAEKVGLGDRIIINGPMGNHSVAILGARKSLSFETPVKSDCASLNLLIKRLLENCSEIHFMRDLTRGGLVAVLNELAAMIKTGIVINESSIPVDEPVKGLCELLGFDPLYLANEGKMIIVAGRNEQDKILEILHDDELGRDAAVIGEITDDSRGMVVLNTQSGGRRILDLPSGIQLPRIC